MAAAAHVSDSDSETLVSLLRLVEATLAAGLHEYTVRAHTHALTGWSPCVVDGPPVSRN